ncbi:MAG: lipocalin family protein [Vulcanimicrobiaceae bacterium]
MNTARRLALAGAGLTAIAALLYGAKRLRSRHRAEIKTVAHVDLDRYQGRWFEIARYPTPFQRRCAKNTTAEYTLRPNGRLYIENRCTTEEGYGEVSRGEATVVDTTTNAKLRVKFSPLMRGGDYWIVDLSPNYRYAVVSEPTREFLWILSRTPSLDQETYGEICTRLFDSGFDLDRLQRTTQDGA